jgi:hypothetical protein
MLNDGMIGSTKFEFLLQPSMTDGNRKVIRFPGTSFPMVTVKRALIVLA